MKIVNFVKRVWILPVSHFALFDVFFNFKNFGRPPEVSVHSQIYHLIPDNSRPETWVQIRIKLNYAQNNVYKNCVISNSIWMIEGINVKINSCYHFINQQHQNLFEFHFNVLSFWMMTHPDWKSLNINLEKPAMISTKSHHQSIRKTLSLIILRASTQTAFTFSCFPPDPHLQ